MLKGRVKAAVDAEGLRPFARRAHVGVGVVRSLLKDGDPSFSSAAALAKAFFLDLSFASSSEDGQFPPKADEGEYAQIPLHAAWLAAGSGVENGDEEVIEHLAFRRTWLQSNDIPAAAARLARVLGKSMEPTICEADMVLIDTSRRTPPNRIRATEDHRAAPIFALVQNGEARIKRLERYSPHELLLISDNKLNPTEKVSEAALTIIGKVIWWGHTNRD